MRLFLVAFAALLPLTVAAQSAECAVGTAEAVLDRGDARAGLYNIGGLFWNGGASQYEVPKGSQTNALFSSSLWVGGLADADLRFAGSAYGPWEYWPGPLDAAGQTTAETCAAFDRIWTVSTDDLDAYATTGTTATDLAEWPVAAGAPFYTDANGNGVQDAGEPTVSLDLGDPGYGTRALDLSAGERPVIFGRQTAWWVMNDAGGPHEWGGTEPLGIEVRATAWTTAYGIERLAQSTFYRFEIVNRSADVLDDVYAGLYIDADLGNFNDDYQHADSTRGMHVFYNGDETDEGGGGYGSPPPAIGIDVLSGASSALHTLKSSGFPANGPQDGTQAYARLRGLLNDGTPMHVGGNGLETTGPTTAWSYTGDPVKGAYWSEENLDGAGTPATPSDKRGLVVSEPARLAPGERMTVDVGILFGRGLGRLESVTAVRDRSDRAQAAHASGELFAASGPGTATPAPLAPALVAPADGAVFEGQPVPFSWAAVAGAAGYILQTDTSRTFANPAARAITTTQVEVPRSAFLNNSVARVYWRVITVDPDGEPSAPSEVRSLRNVFFEPTPVSFEVVANAAGPVDPPHPGAAGFQGFPTPGGASPLIGEQQANGTRWLVATVGGGFDGTFATFLGAVLPGETRERYGTTDFEARFTGPSVAVRASDGLVVEVPFEAWATGEGTPDDTSDDIRMIPVLHDLDGDGAFSLSTADSPVSGVDNDPATDPVTWVYPIDATPGDAGYQAWAASAATDPTAVGGAVFERLAFVGWNLGTEAPYPAERPEDGTILRIVAAQPNLEIPAEPDPPPPPVYVLTLGLQPNPMRTAGVVTYELATAGTVRLRVVDVLGREVAVLAEGAREAGPSSADFDARPLAAGVYVVVLDTDGRRLVRTVTVSR